jgi:hypothetical protein
MAHDGEHSKGLEMHRNPVWLGFLGIIGIIALWFLLSASMDISAYRALSARAPTTVAQWSVEKLGRDRYCPSAVYNFMDNGQLYDGRTIMKYDLYRNEWAAQQRISRAKSEVWNVWFSPSNPEHSSLTREFPVQSIVSAVLMTGIFFYFLWLGFYVGKNPY